MTHHLEHDHRHLSLVDTPALVYAVGDVHGCLAELLALERLIIEDGKAVAGEKLIVMLGDYIDRGPDSAGVIEHMLANPPDGFKRICLTGNHEIMARSFFMRPHPRSEWLEFGGLETLQSYGLSEEILKGTRHSAWPMLIKAHVPDDHVDFLASLPWTLMMPGWLCVHAGIRNGVPLRHQQPDDLFWIRDEFYQAADHDSEESIGFRVIHGHTPALEPVVTRGRICIDTGAYATGRLSAVRIAPDGSHRVLQTDPSASMN